MFGGHPPAGPPIDTRRPRGYDSVAAATPGEPMANADWDNPPRELSADEAVGLLTGSNRGGCYLVQTADAAYSCQLRGRLKLGAESLDQLVIGDRVILKRNPDDPELGTIEAVLPRSTQVGRGRFGKRPQLIAANVDQLVAVMSVWEPDLNYHTLDRYLCIAAVSEVEPLVVLNKADLDEDDELTDELLAAYRPAKIHVLSTSAETHRGLAELRDALRDRISVVVGPSGAGKSSLLNAVNPEYRLRTGEVMSIGKGRHTTTSSRLLPLDGGGWVADTPGIKTLALIADELEPSELQHLFPEFATLLGHCRFADCTHREEPDCAIQMALDEGLLAPTRYESYVRLYHELETARRRW